MRSGSVDFEICRPTDGSDHKAQHIAAIGFERHGWIVAGGDQAAAQGQDRRASLHCNAERDSYVGAVERGYDRAAALCKLWAIC
jgi:hypothetical protein